MWLDEVKKGAIPPEEIYERIASHCEPVIVYGTGGSGRKTTELLKSHGIEVMGYITGREFFPACGEFLGKPVYTLDGHMSRGGVCVLGVGSQSSKEDDMSVFQGIKHLKKFSNVYLYGIHEVINLHDQITYDFLLEHRLEFNRIYELLADMKSREVFVAYLKGMASGIPYYEQADYATYFNELSQPFFGGTFVDCGAYIGDTVEEYINCSGGIYDAVYAIEADPANVDGLRDLVARSNYKNVTIIPKGVGSFSGKVHFNGFGTTSSSVSEAGTMEIEIDKIDNIVGNHSVTFIKMDIEGSEEEALKGAEGTIEKNMPILTICVYHRKDDLIKIPALIDKFRSNGKKYIFYLRKHRFATHDELVLYAIPTMC